MYGYHFKIDFILYLLIILINEITIYNINNDIMDLLKKM